MQEFEEVHTTIVKKTWRDGILPCGATLITLGLLLLLGWALKMGKLYPLKKYVERLRSNDEETAAAAALELSNIDAAQEENVSKKESAKKSALPKISQGETRSKKLLLKTSKQTPPMKRKVYLMLIISLYDDVLMIPLVFICLFKKRRMRTSCICQYSNVYD